MAAKKESGGKAGGPSKRAKQNPRDQREASSRSLDQRIIKALAHPLRVEILAILNDRMASPNELSQELKEGLSQVSYHIKVLKDYSMIEMVKTAPRRGAVEHYYRASEKVFVPAWLMKMIPKSAQQQMFGDVLADIEQDVGTALEKGTFDQRQDWVVGRDPRILDGKGCEDAEKEAAIFFKRYEEIETEAASRRANGEGDGEAISTTAVVLVFGSALGKGLKSSKTKRKKKRS